MSLQEFGIVALTAFPIGVVLIAVLIAAVTDIWAYRVHNALTLPLLGTGLAYHAIVGGLPGFTGSLVSAVIGLSLLFLFFLMGGMGGGDLKLMAGLGAWLGVPLTTSVLAVAAISAGVYAFVLVVVNGRLRETWVNLQIIWHRLGSVGRHLAAEDNVEIEVQRSDRRGRLIPFAAMVAFGVVVIVVRTFVLGRA
jgi:prepilin peptidase CpaA